MPEFIRVRVKDSGTEQTIAKPAAVDPKVYEVLDEPTHDRSGHILPPKFPAKKAAAKKAAAKKAPAKKAAKKPAKKTVNTPVEPEKSGESAGIEKES